MRILFIFFATMLSFSQVKAQISFARIFTDHAVLQRGKPTPVWGWAAPGQMVGIRLGEHTLMAKAEKDGYWKVVFPPSEAGGPFNLSAQSGNEKVELTDIWLGEVWICSGQSNMEWDVRSANNAVVEIKTAKDAMIRHFKVETDISLTPLAKLNPPRSGWKVCSPETVADFTAIGYFFAKNLREQFGPNIAIGLLNTSWGGSHAEAWISKEGLTATEGLKNYAATYPADWTMADELLKKRVQKYCFGEPRAVSSQDELSYAQPGFDFSKWPGGSAPLAWDWQGMWAFRGRGYMARYIDVPEFLNEVAATLSLGESDQVTQIWVNGQPVQLDTVKHKIKATIPVGILKTGKNSLMLHIGAQAEPEWWGMGLHGDPGELKIKWADYSLPLSGDSWHIMPGWNEPFHFAHLQNNVASGIYNAMINPLIPYAFQGVIWYQGESNAERAWQYRETFPALIKDWRRAWNDEFPFLFVQLSSFGHDASANVGSAWAELREAQEKALELPSTGMAVTIDIGTADDIHPRNKQDVGKRLALSALSVAYGKDTLSKGPQLRNVTWEAASAVLIFDNVGEGLMAKDKFGYVRGFEIAGADKKFYYAQAQIIGAGQIVVYHPEGVKPIAIRYAWSDAPTDANVYNSKGLPAGSFRTDDWKCITEGKGFE